MAYQGRESCLQTGGMGRVLNSSLDCLCCHYGECHVGRLPRMVPLARSIPVLFGQGLPKSRALEYQAPRYHCNDFVYVAKVWSSTALRTRYMANGGFAEEFSCP